MSKSTCILRFELQQQSSGQGFVSCTWSRAVEPGEAPGPVLWCGAGYKNPNKVGYVLHFKEGDPELMVRLLQLGAGLMPPGIFADWLEDEHDRLAPLVLDWEPTTPSWNLQQNWDGLLSELRRLDQPAPDPKTDVEPRRMDE